MLFSGASCFFDEDGRVLYFAPTPQASGAHVGCAMHLPRGFGGGLTLHERERERERKREREKERREREIFLVSLSPPLSQNDDSTQLAFALFAPDADPSAALAEFDGGIRIRLRPEVPYLTLNPKPDPSFCI